MASPAARILAVFAGAYLAVTGCDYSQYPIDASFCDGWCRMLRRTACDQEPENCVRDCENSLASERCSGLQSELLSCYEAAPADSFTCVGEGFRASVRPRPEICRDERHALIACEAPQVKACVDACEGLSSPASTNEVALPPGQCPEAPVPCERLCWELDARVAAFGGAGELPAGSDADTALVQLFTPLVACAEARALQCREQALDDELEDPPALSWTRAFTECSGLPEAPRTPRPAGP